jgi:DNA-binding transcriptional regulator PaaX
MIGKEMFSKAYDSLGNSAGALALYVWLVGNQNGFKFGFSPQAILNQCGIPLSTTRAAIKRLEAEGYLVKRENSATRDFYENSRLDVQQEREAKQEEESELPSLESKAKPGEFSF